jgi:hypothetical protein
MSSLFSKLRTLIGARTRGPHRHRKKPDSPDERNEESGPLPEVTEAPARQRKVPEVTEAPESHEVRARTSDAAHQPAARVETPSDQHERPDELESRRVIDLLQDDES